MNRPKSRMFSFLITLTFLLCATAAYAVKGADVVIYNSGRALVKESRSVTLPNGMASVIFKDVPNTLDPTSVRAIGKDMEVLDCEYGYLPISAENLLDRYIGKELSVIMPDPTDANGRTLRKATLLSNNGRPIFQMGSEIYVGNYEALILPELPNELQEGPTLTLTTQNTGQGPRDVHLSYLMSGLNWQADYTFTVDATGTAAAIEGWATLTNNTATDFSATSLKLVAGEVGQEGNSRRMYAKSAMVLENDMSVAAAPVHVEPFSQYHVYEVPRAISFKAAAIKQIRLFAVNHVGIEQKLVSRSSFGIGQRSGTMDQPVESLVTIMNTQKNGLGQPMPAGRVRVLMPDSNGALLLAGESRIDHVGMNGEITIPLGNAFDMQVKRTQTAYAKLGDKSYEMSWEISIVNGRDTVQMVTLDESLSGQWEVTSADAPYSKPDAGTLQFDVAVPPSRAAQPMIVKYTVQVSY